MHPNSEARDVPIPLDADRTALPVPVRSVDTGFLEANRTRCSIPNEGIEHIALVPDFRILDDEVVERVGDTALSIAVEIVGDRDGTYPGIVISAVAAHAIEAFGVPVPADVTVTELVQTSRLAPGLLTMTSSTVSRRARRFSPSTIPELADR